MSHDTWLHRLVRPAVRPLVRTRVTPNHLTTVRLATGLAAAAALGAGGETWPHIGAGLFVLSMLFDRGDGELARLGGRITPWGHKYDLAADAACNVLVFMGLGVGVGGVAAGILGIVAGLAVAGVFWLTLRMERRHGARAAELKGAGGFDPDDAMLAVPLAVWMGLSWPLLVAAAVGAPVFGLLMLAKFRQPLASRGADTTVRRSAGSRS